MVDRIISDAKAFNLNIRKEDKWGYDHGTWSAMLALF